MRCAACVVGAALLFGLLFGVDFVAIFSVRRAAPLLEEISRAAARFASQYFCALVQRTRGAVQRLGAAAVRRPHSRCRSRIPVFGFHRGQIAPSVRVCIQADAAALADRLVELECCDFSKVRQFSNSDCD